MLLTVDKLSKKYKDHVAVKELTLSIEHNQCVALLGPNGSGKTTTLSMLSGLLTPTSGKIVFQGGTTINRHEIGFLPQYPAFFLMDDSNRVFTFCRKTFKSFKKRVAEEK